MMLQTDSSYSPHRKKKILFIGFLLIFFSISVAALVVKKTSSSLSLTDFDYASFLKTCSIPPLPKEFIVHQKADKIFLRKLRSNLKEAFSRRLQRQKIAAEAENRIPRIIHQIWLYDSAPSPDVLYAMSTIRQTNPSCTYILWDRKKADTLLCKAFGNHTQYLTDITAISDYVAASILQEYGGIVIDPWCEGIESIEPFLLPEIGGFVGIEPPCSRVQGKKRRLFASPALIGATAHHPFLSQWKKELLSRLTTLATPSYEHWKLCDPFERMIWLSVDSLTDVITSFSENGKNCKPIIPIGPSWWCPIQARYTLRYQHIIHGTFHRPFLRKIEDIFHIANPPFYSMHDNTILIHQTGGRLGLKEKKVKRIFHIKDL